MRLPVSTNRSRQPARLVSHALQPLRSVEHRSRRTQLAAGPMSEARTFLCFLAIMAFEWMQFTTFRLSGASEPIPAWNYFVHGSGSQLVLEHRSICSSARLAERAHFLYRYFPAVGRRGVGIRCRVARRCMDPEDRAERRVSGCERLVAPRLADAHSAPYWIRQTLRRTKLRVRSARLIASSREGERSSGGGGSRT